MTENNELEAQEKRILEKIIEKAIPAKKWEYTEEKDTCRYESIADNLSILLGKEEKRRATRSQDSFDDWVTTDYLDIYYKLNFRAIEKIDFIAEESFTDGRLTDTDGPLSTLKELFHYVEERVQSYHQTKRLIEHSKLQAEQNRKEALELKKRKKLLTIIERMVVEI